MNYDKLYNEINQIVLNELAKGVIPWRKPWKSVNGLTAHNGITKKPYRGINYFITNIIACKYGYNDFYTFNQLKDKNAYVKKGEKGIKILYYDIKRNDEGEFEYAFTRYSTVFNRGQCEGLKPLKITENTSTISIDDNAEQIIKNYKTCPQIACNGNSAYYMPSTDTVTVPNINQFEKVGEYYSTLFHELVHSTGAKKRLDRLIKTSFGTSEYAKEELVAELGACYLRNICNIDDIDTMKNSASYIEGWSKKLKEDNKFFINASQYAQKAVDYMLNIKYEDNQE